MLTLLLTSSLASAGECTFRTPWDDVSTALDAAEKAYSELDVDGFTVAQDEATISLRCVDAQLTPPQAARLHRNRGLAFFVKGEERASTEALTAARRVEPDYAFPTSLIPPGHSLLDVYDRAALTDVTAPVREPLAGALAFDGIVGPERPADRATVVQLLDEQGGPQWTVYLLSDGPLPEYPAHALPEPPPPGGATVRWVAISAGAVSVALLGAAAGTKAGFDNLEAGAVPAETLQGRKLTNNLLVVSGLAVGGVAAGTAVVGLVGGRF